MARKQETASDFDTDRPAGGTRPKIQVFLDTLETTDPEKYDDLLRVLEDPDGYTANWIAKVLTNKWKFKVGDGAINTWRDANLA